MAVFMCPLKKGVDSKIFPWDCALQKPLPFGVESPCITQYYNTRAIFCQPHLLEDT